MDATELTYTQIPKAFAESGDKNTIDPTSSAIDDAVSFYKGFPEIFSRLINNDGKFIQREDFNGIFYTLSLFLKYLQCGGLVKFDSTLAGQINGYPQGARIWWKKPNRGWILIESKNNGNSTAPLDNGSNVDTFSGNDTSKPWREVSPLDYVDLSNAQTVKGKKTFFDAASFEDEISASGIINANGGMTVPTNKKVVITDTPEDNSDNDTTAVNVQFVRNYHSQHAPTIDTSISETSTNAVQNKVIKSYIDNKIINVGNTRIGATSDLGCLKVCITTELPTNPASDVFYFITAS